MGSDIKHRLQFSFSRKDLLISVCILAATILVSALLQQLQEDDSYVLMLFVLAVFLISRWTTGYLFGTVSSVLSVFLVNFFFTTPYFRINFTLAGYPVTFLVMLITAIMTSTLTTRIKQQERIQVEIEKEKLRANLLRAVSHDLRTPLTSIVGTTSALLDNGEKIPLDQQRGLLLECHDDAEWLIRMVENLLSVTRMSGGEANITKCPEAAEEIVGEAVRKISKRFPDVTVAVSVPDELIMVPMDAMLIEQVLINLIENAILHAGTADGICLAVTKETENAVFTVSDSGNGISEDAFRHLFEGYLSEDNLDDSGGKRNMGIGLSVCLSIVKAHGGTLCGENKTGGGAAFTFTLPLEKENHLC